MGLGFRDEGRVVFQGTPRKSCWSWLRPLYYTSSAMPQSKERSEGDKLLGLEVDTALGPSPKP